MIMTIYRKLIAFIDNAIIALISWRMKVALQIEKEKRKNDLPISFPEIEKKRIEAVKKIAQKREVNPAVIKEIFLAIIKESVRVQERQRKNAE